MRISDWSSDVCSSDLSRIVASTRGVLGRGTQRKIDTALNVFEQHIDGTALLSHLDVPRSEVVTPLMFESEPFERARADRHRIALPERDDARILHAPPAHLARQASGTAP